MIPGKDPRLISYAQPGVAKGAWNITAGQLDELLKKYRLVTRGDIQGRRREELIGDGGVVHEHGRFAEIAARGDGRALGPGGRRL